MIGRRYVIAAAAGVLITVVVCLVFAVSDSSSELPEQTGTEYRDGAVDGNLEARRHERFTTNTGTITPLERTPSGVDILRLEHPDYGGALFRPTATAEFELRDARNRPLEGAKVAKVELWRRVEDNWIRHEVEHDMDASRVLCGTRTAGLPAGSYELDVLAGPYGAVRVPFELGRGEGLLRTIELPNWRRIIRVRFADTHGRRLARITQAPHYVARDATLPERGRASTDRDDEPDDSHPVTPRVGDGPGIGFKPLTTGWEAFYGTDQGAMWMRVFAGAEATLSFELAPDRYLSVPNPVKSDFTGTEWDDYPVIVDPAPELAASMKDWVEMNEGDPGHRSLREQPINPVGAHSDPADTSDLLPGRVRVVVNVDAPVPVTMFSDAGTPRRVDRESLAGRPRTADAVWFMDVMHEPAASELLLSFGFEDDFLLRTVPIRLQLDAAALESRHHETGTLVDALPTTIDVSRPPPTLAAFTTHVDVSLTFGRDERQRIVRVHPDANGMIRIATAVTPATSEAILRAARLSLVYQCSGSSSRYHGSTELDAEQRRSLVDGRLLVNPFRRGFVFRIVDEHLQGVARVSCAVVKHRDLALADRARATLAKREPASSIPPDVRNHLIENDGKWYPPLTRLVSDGHGYVLHEGEALAEGELHALFLWTDSELEPEWRIDFRATENTTDLGAIRLPKHD